MADSGAAALLVERRCVATAPSGFNTLVLEDLPVTTENAVHLPIRGDDVAFVTYTSGSTGRPKGVLVTHSRRTVRQSPDVVAVYSAPDGGTVDDIAPAVQARIDALDQSLLDRPVVTAWTTLAGSRPTVTVPTPIRPCSPVPPTRAGSSPRRRRC